MSGQTTNESANINQAIPAIFVSHGHLGCFSANEPSLSVGTTSTECAKSGDVPDTTYQYYSLPYVEPSPSRALYDFSLELAKNPNVIAVTYQVENDIVLVWTFIARRDKDVRRAIYEAELHLMERFAGMLFDFNVLALNDFSEPLISQNVRGNLTFFRNTNGH